MDTLEYVHKYSNINISRILRNARCAQPTEFWCKNVSVFGTKRNVYELSTYKSFFPRQGRCLIFQANLSGEHGQHFERQSE